MRSYASERIGISSNDSPASWPTPSISVAKNYNKRNPVFPCEGPTNEDLRIDWFCPGATKWTKDCSTIFAYDMCRQPRYQEMSSIRYMYTEATVAGAFKRFILSLKQQYRRESADPIAATDFKISSRKRARTLSRRKQVSLLTKSTFNRF